MSLDAASMSREDLISELESVREERNQLEARVDALSRQFEALKTALVGRGDDFYQYTFDEENNLLGRLEELEGRLGHVEEIVDHDIGELEYEQLTKRDKVRQIQDSLIQEAEERPNGKAAMDYQDVRWLFDGNPSRGHTYDLMRLAAGEDGFTYEESSDENNRLKADLGTAKDSIRFRTANTRTT